MELYNAVASWTGWPPVVAILLVLGGFGYWMLQRYIDILTEQKDNLQNQLSLAREQTPDVLAQQLTGRLQAYEQELARMRKDGQSAQASLRTKEAEIKAVNLQIDELRGQMLKANSTLQAVTEYDLLCPHCGAPLVVREAHSEWAEHEGRDIEFDREYSRFECGFETFDGHGPDRCPRSSSAKKRGEE